MRAGTSQAGMSVSNARTSHPLNGQTHLLCLPSSAHKLFLKLVLTPHDLHALSTTTFNRLDKYRVSNLARLLFQKVYILISTMITGHARYTGSKHDVFRSTLGAHGGDGGRWRTDEFDTRRREERGEGRVLR